MKEKYEISYHEDFARKVENITDYILYELQNQIASQQFQMNLFQRISILLYFPSAMPVFRKTNYRYLIMKHWLILYKIQDSLVTISKIFSSKQDIENKFL